LYEKNTEDLLSGQAIIAKAKEAVKEAKKMNGLMSVAIREGVLQKVEGGEYGLPSGRSEDDFDLWLLKRVYNWEKYYGASGKQQFNCNTNKISNSPEEVGSNAPTTTTATKEEAGLRITRVSTKTASSTMNSSR
jgi:hypothetical protein